MFDNVIDGDLVIGDPAYETADAAYGKLAGLDLSCLIVCVAGWIPTHAVIRVTDHFRHIPMLLYGTQFEGNSMRGKIGVEVEPYEMLEMVSAIDTLESEAIAEGVNFVKTNWVFKKECADTTIEQGVKYALAIAKKIRERGWEAITLIDVDGMKKIEGFPPAMVFMLLEHYCGVLTVPENDVMGAVTQLIMWYRLSRREDDFRIECSEDGIRFHQMRVCHIFEAADEIAFGIYACSPEDSSFKATFTNMELTECKWLPHDGQQPDEG